MTFWKWLLYSSLLTCNFAQNISFTLDIFTPDRLGTESCQIKMGGVDPNPSLIQEKVCTRMKFITGSSHWYHHLEVECVEPGVVDVKFYYSPCACGDSCYHLIRFIYGTCTELPDRVSYGRAHWEGSCIDSSVSTSTFPTVSPTKRPTTSFPSAGPSTGPSMMPTLSSPTQSPTIAPPANAPEIGIVGVMFLVLLFLLGAWILIHCVLYWKFAFYKSASLFQWESLTWTLFLAHTFDFCSDVFVCYETSCIFGTSKWPFLVSCFSLVLSICVNFYHLIKFLNFSFRNTDTKHWLLKDKGLQMIVFIFLLCGGNPSFLSVLASMVIINRAPLTAMEIMHFSSHRWTVVVMENIPQLIVGIWTLQKSKKSVKLFVILSIAFSFISSVSILIISWYQKHHQIVPVRMEIKMYNIPRLRRIHFIPVQKLLERTHEGISIEVYHVQQTSGGLAIRFAVYEIHADKYEKSKREAISKFTALFRDRTDWLHKKEDVEDFTKVKGTARRIKAFPEMDIEKLTSVEGEVGERERGHTEFDIRCPNSPSEEDESYALDACQMSFVTSRTYSACTSDFELHHWCESPQQGGACLEGFQSTSPKASESIHSLHL